jgi:hypothetical protein
MPDLTPSLALKGEAKRLYRLLRVALYIVFFLVLGLVAIRFIFPASEASFDFRSFGSSRNSIVLPRLALTNAPLESGEVKPGERVLWNASAVGDFSAADISLSAEDQDTLEGATVSVIRAYRAFLYPVGAAVTFREGSLLTDGKDFFLVSGDSLRRFGNLSEAEAYGYQKEQFLAVPEADLVNEKHGSDIPLPKDPSDALLEGALYHIGESYYQAKGGSLVPFVSERAYFSQFREEDALPRDGSFLEAHPATNDLSFGFLPGTLISYGEAVYMVSTGNTLRPIDSPDTFLGKGYQWESIIPATGEEFGIYALGSLYTIKQPHPDGTLFYAEDGARLYVVENGFKRPITNDAVKAEFRSIVPVTVHSLPPEQSCTLAKSTWLPGVACTIPLDSFRQELSGEYQFSLVPKEGTKLTSIDIDFIRYTNKENLKAFVTDLLTKLATRY